PAPRRRDARRRRAVRRAARLAGPRGGRSRLRAQPWTARARGLRRRVARPSRPSALQLPGRSRRHHHMRRTMKTWMFGTACVTAAVLVAGCGSSSDDKPAASQSTPAATSAPDLSAALGSENKATGTPITVGMMNLESGPVAFPEYAAAAKAAVQYINDYKGG